jgi:isoleucyl-tRNA synthetase
LNHQYFRRMARATTFEAVPEKPHFPTEEEKVLAYWEEIDAFHKQLELSEGKPEFTFYDGPPFATGKPHYGHIAAGTIKDVVTRYATMKGHHVERRFGWDCHGLPIEFEIDKTHNISSSVEREELGVRRYNELCREIVMRYSKEWEKTVTRFARWIDFERDYKTMDKDYMESVWWTFKQVFDRDLVYRGTKIMPFSTACNTVLSNFEAGSNYKEVPDPAIIITFPVLQDGEPTSFIAWTTTPWTLPSNLALAVNPKLDYVRWRDAETEKVYICMKDRLEYVKKQTRIKQATVLEEFKGAALVGKRYEPLFNYFREREADGCFQVLSAEFVTKDTGTGIVHCAPGFGEDDYAACVAAGIIQPGKAPVPIDADGKFLPAVDAY